MPIIKCHTCAGTGEYSKMVQCPNCKGLGSTKITLGVEQEEQNDAACQDCGGTGKVQQQEQCQRCGGSGEVWQCLLCGLQMSFSKEERNQLAQKELCDRCKENPVVYHLVAPYDINLVKVGRRFIGKVVSFRPFGAVVELAPNIEGLIRKETLQVRLNQGESIVVRTVRADPNIELVHIPISEYREQDLYGNWKFAKINAIQHITVGQTVYLRAEIAGIKQTSGPTIFTLSDETGTIQGVNFDDSRRNISNLEVGMIVDIQGRRIVHRGTDQIEIGSIQKSPDDQSESFRARLEKRVEDMAAPDSSISLLANTPILQKMKPAIITIAGRIRKAILENQKILIRHHGDVDGFCGAMALEFAIRSMLLQEGVEEENLRRRVQRQISRFPYYSSIDTVRDLNFAIDEIQRFGGKLPLLVLVDIGSTYENQLSFNICQVYSQDVIVIDHHLPNSELDDLKRDIVNPYLVEGDYSVTSGMIGVEIARFIDPRVSGRIALLAAVAGVADHMESPELESYVRFVEKKGYSKEFIEQTVKALNYFLYLLKTGDGGTLIMDVLGLSGERDRHRKLVELLSTETEKAILSALEIALPNVKEIELENQIHFYLLDAEIFGKRRDYPTSGKLTGAVHDYYVSQSPQEKIVTLGYGSDFGILRSEGINIDFPTIVKELQQENPTLGIEGGGHLDVGSLNFAEGTRKEALEKLIEKIESIEIPNEPKT